MHYYQFNIADYANSTQHLEPMEDLAYRRMLDLYYMKESPLPESIDEIARLIRMRLHTECIAVVLQDFFIKTKSGYVNITADEVLSCIYEKSEKAKAAANARWNKIKELQESNEDADAMRTHSECNADGMLPKDLIPKDLIEIAPVKKESKKPKGLTEFPDEFEITEKMVEWFFAQGFKYINIEKATDSWVDAMRAKGNKYKDWSAAWRTGMNNAEKWSVPK